MSVEPRMLVLRQCVQNLLLAALQKPFDRLLFRELLRHFLFFRSYPKIIAGSKIIIPEKTLMDVKKFGVGEISGAATLAATLLTSMIAVYSVLKR